MSFVPEARLVAILRAIECLLFDDSLVVEPVQENKAPGNRHVDWVPQVETVVTSGVQTAEEQGWPVVVSVLD